MAASVMEDSAMRWFSRLWPDRPACPRPPRRCACRFTLESLEDRTLLSTFAVVPAALADKVSKFSDLASVLAVAKNGDTIQIEPSSAPGAALVTQNNLTIQGDPADVPSALPQVGALTIAAGATGVTLTNLNLSTVTLVNGSNHTQITNSLVQQVNEAASGTGNGSNLLSGDTVSGNVILYGNPAGTATGDQVLNNVFTGNASSTAYLFLQHDDAALVQGNSFTSTGTGAAAIEAMDSQGVQVVSNVIHFSAGGLGVVIESQAAAATATLTQNQVDTAGLGTGVYVTKEVAAHTTNVVLTGNDLHANNVGLVVCGDGTNLGTTDAGGGGTSTGGNDFAGFSVANGRSAIYTMHASAGTVSALGNHWTGRPEHAVYAVPGTSIVVSNLPNDRYVFVQALYNDFLKRDGTLAELGAWVALLPQLGTNGIANAIMRSPEALTNVVNGLYQQYLGRPVDPTGQVGWVNFLQHGGTEEQVIGYLVGSPEFQAHVTTLVGTPVSPGADFIQGLYQVLLHRPASGGEVGAWLGVLSTWGRTTVVNLILGSGEFRSGQVQAAYALLHRPGPPAPTEVAAWAGTGLDLLSIEVLIAGGAEFYNDG
jgi:hypothetical protein